jgi:hypothetical protein
MSNSDTFLINYDPFESKVVFKIFKGFGVSAGLPDGEPLKEYENIDGIFNLEGQYEKIFDFIKENFDGKPEISLKIEVSQLGFNKKQIEFERFKERVNKFNKGSVIKVNLKIDIIRLAPIETTPSVEVSQSSASETTQTNVDIPPPVTVKPAVKVAVIGKISSGKTTLIEGLTIHNNSTCESSSLSCGTTKYYDVSNNIEWYEIAGIEFGKEPVAKASEVLDSLIAVNGVSIVLYCLNARTGKIEDIERDFIVDVKRKNLAVIVFGVITACVDESRSRDFAVKVSSTTKQTKVFTVLAKEMRTKAGYLEPFGLDELIKNIFGD